ncbi:hypothetical protein PIB30_046235, partial [Stylosanthes scabra]|nr:hypothetical protein [Stylosanthes scabra]
MENIRNSRDEDEIRDNDDRETIMHQRSSEKKLKKRMKALQRAVEKQEGHLSNLQSSAFQLANYYFVFQGVIITALCNGNTVLKCSDRWFLATLSALAASLNFAALVSIGTKYIRVMTQRDRTWSKYNQLHMEFTNLELHGNQSQELLSSRNLSGVSSLGCSSSASLVASGGDNNSSSPEHGWWDYARVITRGT